MSMSPSQLAERADFIERVIRQAGLEAKRLYDARQPGDYTLKGPQDFLTEADTAVENLLFDAIKARFADDAFLGEETGGDCDGQATWVVDPIDGTANYARGIDHFCVCIAFIDAGQTELGAIYNPCSEELYLTRRGQGAYKNGRRLDVAGTECLATATIEMGWSTRTTLSTYLDTQAALILEGANVRRGASGALALAWVAEGRTDGYLEHHMNPWDSLAGLLMVKEAGGVTHPYLSLSNTLAQGGPVMAAAPGIAQALAHHSRLNHQEIA
ncbi:MULTISPECIES: inositol monophosphatase family protein [unclassified Halomonas]|uniref:inositol monophosphatase family protein n=1 Tax=unclassified Halomonas TaxID=2609666 RepID=UPI002076B4D7|nr:MULTISPECIES: inositol monophosphatase family protein [unclassified Halomonas]